jgi:ribokinase
MSRVITVGSIYVDLRIRLPKIPEQGEMLFGKSYALLPAGRGLNQAVAAHRAGSPVIFVGALGSDDLAPRLRSFMQEEGFNMSFLPTVDDSTGLALAFVGADEMRYVADVPGANECVEAQMLDIVDFRRSDIVLLQNEIPEETNFEAIRRAKRAGSQVIFNLAPYRPVPASVLRSVDCVVLNRTEFSHLVGERPATMSPRQVEGLLASGAAADSNVVVTLDSDGLSARLDGSMLSLDRYDVPVRDATGAGDCFCGVFASARASGHSLRESLYFANAAAALCVQNVGSAAEMPSRRDIYVFLQENGIRTNVGYRTTQ